MHESGMFLNGWAGGDLRTLQSWFDIGPDAFDGLEILLASYEQNDEGGEAFVLFQRDGDLYEVNASHSTGERFEGQWEPEETSIPELRHRLEKGRLGQSDTGEDLFGNELRFLLLELEAEEK